MPKRRGMTVDGMIEEMKSALGVQGEFVEDCDWRRYSTDLALVLCAPSRSRPALPVPPRHPRRAMVNVEQLKLDARVQRRGLALGLSTRPTSVQRRGSSVVVVAVHRQIRCVTIRSSAAVELVVSGWNGSARGVTSRQCCIGIAEARCVNAI